VSASIDAIEYCTCEPQSLQLHVGFFSDVVWQPQPVAQLFPPAARVRRLAIMPAGALVTRNASKVMQVTRRRHCRFIRTLVPKDSKPPDAGFIRYTFRQIRSMPATHSLTTMSFSV